MFKLFEFKGYEVKEKMMKIYLKIFIENSINYACLIKHGQTTLCTHASCTVQANCWASLVTYMVKNLPEMQ